MRDIKFRVWHKKSKQMYYSGQWHFNSEYQMIALSLNLGNKDELYLDDEQKELEIMQFTGLKDANGQDIYEGDIIEWMIILKNEFYEKAEVRFEDGCFYVDQYPLGKLVGNDIRVIGNIYENPELPVSPKKE